MTQTTNEPMTLICQDCLTKALSAGYQMNITLSFNTIAMCDQCGKMEVCASIPTALLAKITAGAVPSAVAQVAPPEPTLAEVVQALRLTIQGVTSLSQRVDDLGVRVDALAGLPAGKTATKSLVSGASAALDQTMDLAGGLVGGVFKATGVVVDTGFNVLGDVMNGIGGIISAFDTRKAPPSDTRS
jgi:hypothetical protein